MSQPPGVELEDFFAALEAGYGRNGDPVSTRESEEPLRSRTPRQRRRVLRDSPLGTPPERPPPPPLPLPLPPPPPPSVPLPRYGDEAGIDPVTEQPIVLPSLVSLGPTYQSLDQANLEQRAITRRDVDDILGSPRSRSLIRHSKCFLCTFGNRTIDGGAFGSKLFSSLIVILNHNYATMSPIALTHLCHNYIETKMRPEFLKARVSFPTVDFNEIHEHLSTMEHSLNPKMFLMNQIRRLGRIQDGLVHYMFPKAAAPGAPVAEPNLKMVAAVVKLSDTIRACYNIDVNKMAFNTPSPNDIDPEIVAHFAASSGAAALHNEIPKSLAGFAQSLLERGDDDDNEAEGETAPPTAH